VAQLLSAPAVQFKGTGWYVTDYGRKPAPKDGGKPSETKSEGKTESAKPETSKPASKDKK